MSRINGPSNNQLLTDLKALLKRSRILEAEVISHLGEVEARRPHLEQGCSSMFDYCVCVLRFSERVAYKRIGVARVVRKKKIGACDSARSVGESEIRKSDARGLFPLPCEEQSGRETPAAVPTNRETAFAAGGA